MTITHRKRLLVAAAAIEVIMRDMNTAMTICSDCRVPRFENFTEEIAHRKLLSQVKKLREMSRSVDPWLDRTVEVPQ